jgi:beta-phosphoglucomutase
MRAVIFDMDGVLVLSGDAHFRAWRETARERGIDLTRERFAHHFGRTNPDIIRDLWGPSLPAGEAAVIADRKERAYRDLVRADVPVAPGVEPLLESLASAGFVLGVGSSAPRENIDLLLDSARIGRYFAAIVDGSMVERGKPAPDVFLHAARLAAVDPAHSVVVEDAPAGIEAARSAGMRSIGLATTHEAADLRRCGADEVFGTLAELDVEVFERLTRPPRK